MSVIISVVSMDIIYSPQKITLFLHLVKKFNPTATTLPMMHSKMEPKLNSNIQNVLVLQVLRKFEI